MINKRALAFSFFVNSFFLGLCLFFGNLRFGAIDDYFMSGILSGIYGDNNVHLTFVNALYGYCLLPLYHLFPKINWYYIGEITSVFISLNIVCYIIIQKVGEKWGVILATIFVALCASDYYLVVQFTQCAAMLSAVGMLCIIHGFEKWDVDRDKRRKGTVFISIGVILLCWGSWMRWQAFLMGLPFLAIALLINVKELWSKRLVVVATLLVLSVGVFGSHLFDQCMYRAPEYKTYIDFQGPRSLLGDGRNYNQQAVDEDLDEMGYSGKDFTMLIDWIFYDNVVFAPDSIHVVTNVIDKYSYHVNLYTLPITVLRTLPKSVRSPIFVAWFLCSIAVLLFGSRKRLWVWASLIMVLSLVGYLLHLQRLVYRVESGLWLYAAVLTIPLLKERFYISRSFSALVVTIVVLFNVLCYVTEGFRVRSPNTGELVFVQNEMVDYADYKGLQAYMDSLPDSSVFFMNMNSYMRLSRKKNPPYLAEAKGSWDRIYSFGFWTPYFPDVEKSFRKRGITNPIQDVVKDNVFVIDEPSLVDFLERHYYEKVEKNVVRDFNGMVVYKYSIAKDSITGMK